jgi:thermostable 8-oxoguanine DNA glycosylase
MCLVTSTKKTFSALEMQKQIGHKFYEPIWEMMHKIRRAMGERDATYKLHDQVEVDDGFFEVVKTKKERKEETEQLVAPKKKEEKVQISNRQYW